MKNKENCKHFTEIVCHKIDCKTQCRYYGKANCHNCTHKSICTYFENCDCEQEVKEYGCKHYQPKLPKDSVVISKEEYTELKFTKRLLELREETIKYLEDANIRYAEALELKVNKKERKETVEKYSAMVEDFISELYNNAKISRDQKYLLLKRNRRVAGQLCAETEE